MLACSACGAPNDDHARFCSGCGKPQAAPPPAPAPAPAAAPDLANATMPPGLQASGLRICAHCGANVPPVLQACGACNGPVAQSISIPYPPPGVMFIQVRLKFGCVQCGQRSPIDTLDGDGRYFCFGCNQERLFDTDMWKEKLVRIANVVGDAFWTNMRIYPAWPPVLPEEDWLEDQDGWDSVAEIIPELMKGFLSKIGVERARLTMEQEGTVYGSGGMKTGTSDVALFPGHPLCSSCRSPLEVAFPARGVAQVVCRRCNVHETHVAPDNLLAECPELLAALAPDLVQGRAPARVEAKAGTAALAILCPQCGSALALPQGTRVAVCQYCKTSSLIPEKVTSAPGKIPDPEAWWMILYAPSSLRTLLSQPGAGRTADDD